MDYPNAPRVAVSVSPALAGSLGAARALGVDAVAALGATPPKRVDTLVVADGDVAYGRDARLAIRQAQQRGVPAMIVFRAPIFAARIGREPIGWRVVSGASLSRRSGAPVGWCAEVGATLESNAAVARLHSSGLAHEARQAVARMVSEGVGFDRCERNLPARDVADGTSDTLVIDGDARDLPSNPRRLVKMISAALAATRGRVLVRLHSQNSASTTGSNPRIVQVPSDAAIASLLGGISRVFVDASAIGLFALAHDKEVSTFGAPYYARWGLTQDQAEPTPLAVRTLAEVFAAAHLEGTVYLHPETGRRCALVDVIAHESLQRRYTLPHGQSFEAVGFSPWKRAFVGGFLASPPSPIVHVRHAQRETADGVIRVRWGRRAPQGGGQPSLRMEDGFLRSTGLGSDFHAPLSLVVDSRGIYFDPTTPSDLEHLLETTDFDDAELARARALRRQIVRANVSKYQVGAHDTLSIPASARGRDILLVVGQVEDDASIEFGCIDVRTNAALLEAARRRRPNAFIVFRPHPDVSRGNRKGHVAPQRLTALADLVVTQVSIAACLTMVSEVHTMTSLVGFEALLRELPVVVYGQPFYAGWGLTDDLHPHPRRTRRRSVDELVAAALIHYPRYVHPHTREFTTPEAAVTLLAADGRGSSEPALTSRIVGLGRALAEMARGVRRGH